MLFVLLILSLLNLNANITFQKISFSKNRLHIFGLNIDIFKKFSIKELVKENNSILFSQVNLENDDFKILCNKILLDSENSIKKQLLFYIFEIENKNNFLMQASLINLIDLSLNNFMVENLKIVSALSFDKWIFESEKFYFKDDYFIFKNNLFKVFGINFKIFDLRVKEKFCSGWKMPSFSIFDQVYTTALKFPYYFYINKFNDLQLTAILGWKKIGLEILYKTYAKDHLLNLLIDCHLGYKNKVFSNFFIRMFQKDESDFLCYDFMLFNSFNLLFKNFYKINNYFGAKIPSYFFYNYFNNNLDFVVGIYNLFNNQDFFLQLPLKFEFNKLFKDQNFGLQFRFFGCPFYQHARLNKIHMLYNTNGKIYFPYRLNNFHGKSSFHLNLKKDLTVGFEQKFAFDWKVKIKNISQNMNHTQSIFFNFNIAKKFKQNFNNLNSDFHIQSPKMPYFSTGFKHSGPKFNASIAYKRLFYDFPKITSKNFICIDFNVFFHKNIIYLNYVGNFDLSSLNFVLGYIFKKDNLTLNIGYIFKQDNFLNFNLNYLFNKKFSLESNLMTNLNNLRIKKFEINFVFITQSWIFKFGINSAYDDVMKHKQYYGLNFSLSFNGLDEIPKIYNNLKMLNKSDFNSVVDFAKKFNENGFNENF